MGPGAVPIEHFADRLLARCQRVGAAVCVGIDPVYERLPEPIRREYGLTGPIGVREAVGAIVAFTRGVLGAVAEHAACVKLQSACFERYLWPGVRAYYELISHAQELGLLVIGDAKRGDIGVSAAHYASGCLGPSCYADLPGVAGPDALTVNAYLGGDGLEPFLKVAADRGKAVFALVRTSNPGGDAVQGLTLKDGRTVAEAVAGMIAGLGSGPGYVGQCGYSLLGAVVGATKATEAPKLRELMPRQVFLVPGFGAQGATARELAGYFNPDGGGAIITASRSVIYAYESDASTDDWTVAVRRASERMKHQIAAVSGG